ncbi:1-phosphofructokinase family hexose kinase [Agromyces terreus]|uniref:1-phosphofructokinase family hexose kinase n=1 Tax=Agromyces terreus TaxID=424795 RepID=A0A9X2GYB4_9MICO|nr:PfkB family carbohydrate kinase [Agromyces terreus]MCP2369395.1 1-phosphofructokinase family hexose kinase [Agromyces terreus]
MILTVTPNPALDLTWQVAGLHPGETHRVGAGVARAGGKGLNVARVLHAQGHDVLALTTAGGTAGDELAADLAESGVPHRLVPVAGSTRRSIAIVDTEAAEASILNEHGAPLGADEAESLVAEALSLALDGSSKARVAAISGSLPPGFTGERVTRLVRELAAGGVRVIVDTSGPGMLDAARAGAYAMKPNREELVAATGLADPVDGARALLDLGARLVVVSLGTEGLMLVSRAEDGIPVRARLPRVLRGNATGAGDAAVAAMAASLLDPLEFDADTAEASAARRDLARLATAWSASAVLAPLAGSLGANHRELAAEIEVAPPPPAHRAAPADDTPATDDTEDPA